MNKRGKTIMMLCLTVLLLGAYSVKAAGNTGYSTTLELTGMEKNGTFYLHYPSGELAASIPRELAASGFPASEPPAEGETASFPGTVFYGGNGKGLEWAVVCSGPSAGLCNTNVLLSKASGESWKLISSCENTPHELVTGAGFQDERTGFLSCRYTQDAGPVIYATQDGGSSWERLPVAEGYDGFSKTPGSPVMTAQSVWFPVVLRDEAGNETTVYYSSQDMETWSWG